MPHKMWFSDSKEYIHVLSLSLFFNDFTSCQHFLANLIQCMPNRGKTKSDLNFKLFISPNNQAAEGINRMNLSTV